MEADFAPQSGAFSCCMHKLLQFRCGSTTFVPTSFPENNQSADEITIYALVISFYFIHSFPTFQKGTSTRLSINSDIVDFDEIFSTGKLLEFFKR